MVSIAGKRHRLLNHCANRFAPHLARIPVLSHQDIVRLRQEAAQPLGFLFSHRLPVILLSPSLPAQEPFPSACRLLHKFLVINPFALLIKAGSQHYSATSADVPPPLPSGLERIGPATRRFFVRFQRQDCSCSNVQDRFFRVFVEYTEKQLGSWISRFCQADGSKLEAIHLMNYKSSEHLARGHLLL